MSKPRSYPYKGTRVSLDSSRAEIDQLLRKYGITATQWTTVWDESRIELRFPIEVTVEGIHKKVMVSIKPPLFMSKHRSYDARKGYVQITAPDFKASMRALFFYIKAMLEAQFYGLAKIEDVFMSHIVASMTDDSGVIREVSLGDRMRASILKGEIPALTNGGAT